MRIFLFDSENSPRCLFYYYFVSKFQPIWKYLKFYLRINSDISSSTDWDWFRAEIFRSISVFLLLFCIHIKWAIEFTWSNYDLFQILLILQNNLHPKANQILPCLPNSMIPNSIKLTEGLLPNWLTRRNSKKTFLGF